MVRIDVNPYPTSQWDCQAVRGPSPFALEGP
jgi:hypothetical protein